MDPVDALLGMVIATTAGLLIGGALCFAFEWMEKHFG